MATSPRETESSSLGPRVSQLLAWGLYLLPCLGLEGAGCAEGQEPLLHPLGREPSPHLVPHIYGKCLQSSCILGVLRTPRRPKTEGGPAQRHHLVTRLRGRGGDWALVGL